ncbi:hypothetical protein PLESTF_000917400 [Pleodorina starrii]|nr:hypothetical protein PLESTF_000917400 [Pleodorina starrii]
MDGSAAYKRWQGGSRGGGAAGSGGGGRLGSAVASGGSSTAPRRRGNTDTVKLLMLGYRQELVREFTLFNSFGSNLNVLSSFTALAGSYGIGVGFAYGGPVVMTWGLMVVMLLTLSVGLSLAELASAYPTSGALYYWSYRLAPTRIRTLVCFITAWVITLGQAALSASATFTFVEFVEVAVEQQFGRSLSGVHRLSILAATLVVVGLLNCGSSRTTAFLTTLGAFWHTLALVGFCSALLLLAPKRQSAEYVFTSWQTDSSVTGITSPLYNVLMGILMAQWTFTGWDGAAHNSEETLAAEVAVPAAMLLSIGGAGLCGLALVLTLVAVKMDEYDIVYDASGNSNMVLQILDKILDVSSATPGSSSTSSSTNISSSVALFTIPLVGAFFCSFQAIANNARMLYAFARDGGVPLSRLAGRLQPRTAAPLGASLYMLVACAVLAVPMCFEPNVFPIVTSFAVLACYAAYGVPVVCKLTTGRRHFLPGPFQLRPWLSTANNLLSTTWIGVVLALFVLPASRPVTPGSLNWSGPMLGGLLGGLTAWYFFPKYGARSWFRGPRPNLGQFQDVLPSDLAREAAAAAAAAAAAVAEEEGEEEGEEAGKRRRGEQAPGEEAAAAAAAAAAAGYSGVGAGNADGGPASGRQSGGSRRRLGSAVTEGRCPRLHPGGTDTATTQVASAARRPAPLHFAAAGSEGEQQAAGAAGAAAPPPSAAVGGGGGGGAGAGSAQAVGPAPAPRLGPQLPAPLPAQPAGWAAEATFAVRGAAEATLAVRGAGGGGGGRSKTAAGFLSRGGGGDDVGDGDGGGGDGGGVFLGARGSGGAGGAAISFLRQLLQISPGGGGGGGSGAAEMMPAAGGTGGGLLYDAATAPCEGCYSQPLATARAARGRFNSACGGGGFGGGGRRQLRRLSGSLHGPPAVAASRRLSGSESILSLGFGFGFGFGSGSGPLSGAGMAAPLRGPTPSATPGSHPHHPHHYHQPQPPSPLPSSPRTPGERARAREREKDGGGGGGGRSSDTGSRLLALAHQQRRSSGVYATGDCGGGGGGSGSGFVSGGCALATAADVRMLVERRAAAAAAAAAAAGAEGSGQYGSTDECISPRRCSAARRQSPNVSVVMALPPPPLLPGAGAGAGGVGAGIAGVSGRVSSGGGGGGMLGCGGHPSLVLLAAANASLASVHSGPTAEGVVLPVS